VCRAARYSDCETGDGEMTNTWNNPFEALWYVADALVATYM